MPFAEDEAAFVADVRTAVDESLARTGNNVQEADLVEKILHDDLAELVWRRLRRRPMILPVVVEV